MTMRASVLWLAVTAALPCFGQSRISGLVLDPSGKSVPGATVQLKSAGASSRADEQGRYEILTAPGTWELTFQAPGQYAYVDPFHPGMLGEINVIP